MPVLHLVAGPNGAGKSTYVDLVLGVTQLPFINADLIAARRWPEAPGPHAYEAAAQAAEERQAMLALGRSFITETVFSHESKLDLLMAAARAGYITTLHVILIPEAMAVHRVQSRVDAGGHDVPAEKIVARYRRLWPLVRRAARLADVAEVRDNSRAATPFRLVASYRRGHLVQPPDWPTWTSPELR